MQATQGRIILAWIIDLMVLSVPLYYLKLLLPFKEDPLWELASFIGVFVLLRMVIHAVVGAPGYHCLAIDFDGSVNQDVKQRETLLTVIVGILFIAAGSIWLKRWHYDETVYPVFGMLLPQTTYAGVAIIWGLFDMMLGLFILNMTRLGFYLALVGAALALTSALASWSQMDAFVARMLLDEASARGLAAAAPAVASITDVVQRFAHWAAVLPALVLVAIMLLHGNRFRVFPDDETKKPVKPSSYYS